MRDERPNQRRTPLKAARSSLRGGAATVLMLATAAPLSGRAQDRDAPPPLPYVLQLQTEQAQAWRAYRDELALERVDAAEAEAQADQLNAMTTPQRIDHQLAQLPMREAQMRRQAQAVRAFYAQLSPAQRRVFDRITRAPTPTPPERAGHLQARQRHPQLPQPPEGTPLPLPGG